MSSTSPLASATTTTVTSSATTAAASAAAAAAAVVTHYWKRDDAISKVNCLCLGTGRFLRSVLVPVLEQAGLYPALIQTRGTSFLEYMTALDHAAAEALDDDAATATAAAFTTATATVKNNDSGHGRYPVDTVEPSGDINTTMVSIYGAFSMGTPETRAATLEFLQSLAQRSSSTIPVIGVGVTEAGLVSADTPAMKDLALILATLLVNKKVSDDHDDDQDETKKNTIVILNTDNVLYNGDLIQSHLTTLLDTTTTTTSSTTIKCLNTMVDRITSSRPGSEGMVPRAEPLPQKALVILDPEHLLETHVSSQFASISKSASSLPGVVVRSTRDELDMDISLKLRIANGTHTAMAHAMALQGILLTDVLAPSSDDTDISSTSTTPTNVWWNYLNSMVDDQILRAAIPRYGPQEPQACWKDWKTRLMHPKYGLSSFFITQNGAAKGGIRWGPTVRDLLQEKNDAVTAATENCPITVSMALAYAILLRWLTPYYDEPTSTTTVFRGKLDIGTTPTTGPLDETTSPTTTTAAVEYADGLKYDLQEGWYEFKCACHIHDGITTPVSTALYSLRGQQPNAFEPVIYSYLMESTGGDLSGLLVHEAKSTTTFIRSHLTVMVKAIATLLARMVAGDTIQSIMMEIHLKQGVYKEGFSTPCHVLMDGGKHKNDSGTTASTGVLHYTPSPIPDTSALMTKEIVPSEMTTNQDVSQIVFAEVAATKIIDLHTHLLPPTHGPQLCLWGPDELITYHYLVAEFFMTAPMNLAPEEFYSFTKQRQADMIWQALFLDRLPLSEACRGVLTTFRAMGIHSTATLRDLHAIRAHYEEMFHGDADVFSKHIYDISGLSYAIMTNIPFSQVEAQCWVPRRVEYDTTRYHAALRVDPLLAGDERTMIATLQAAGYPITLEGAKQYLRDWCDIMKPEYVMASTPHDFVFQEGTLAGLRNTGINTETMKTPGAFAAAMASPEMSCPPQEEESPSLIDENSDFLKHVLVPVCEERHLAIALKIGAHRAINAPLQAAGDGMASFCDTSILSRLCTQYPKIRFLATFLSRTNQHEACVLASKFRNLHLYGCWWYCNNPSIIAEMTKMRIEMLGTAFTAQHSDARVLDQLVYKWSHSRAVIAKVLSQEMTKLLSVDGNEYWNPTRAEIRREVRRLFGGSYQEFMAK